MPAIVLHQPIEGKNVGDTVDVPQARADFYVALGYASVPGQDAPVAVPGADVDPTLAANREGPDEEPLSSPDVVPAESGHTAGSADAHREAQAKADEESEKVRAKSAELREEVEDGSTTEVLEAQAEADEDSEISAGLGDNAADEPGDRVVPVTEPAEPAIPAVDPGVLDVADGEATPATKGTRPKRR